MNGKSHGHEGTLSLGEEGWGGVKEGGKIPKTAGQ